MKISTTSCCSVLRPSLYAIGWPAAPHLLDFREIWALPALPDETPPAVRSAIITAILWNIWKARNSWIFDSSLHAAATTVCNIAGDLRLWTYRVKSTLASDFLRMCGLNSFM
uniref:Reverse transcriptase zinc-binding domain-containing protein n=1 Tax=Setaria viridis TaxID=4556 RepID=A0A4U6UVJ0_SETVI|nr:LOW QUALITY PROTEIN: hypothetical protein SEVIR_4G043300v2 [Setaria viridis]